MRHIIASVSLMAIAIVSLAACSSSRKFHNTRGKVRRSCSNSIMLNSDNQEYVFDLGLSPVRKNAWLMEGDSVSMVYTTVGDELRIEEIAVISHSMPNMNNAAAMLVGSWSAAKGNYSLTLSADGKACTTTGGGSVDGKWILSGRDVVMHAGDAERRYALIRVDNETLTMKDGSRVLKLVKRN